MRIHLDSVIFTVAMFLASGLNAGSSFSPLPEGTKADLIVVEKAKRVLTAYSKGIVLRSYQVALSTSSVGPKEREGDNRTPEGDFIIDSSLQKSGYHRALHISYPRPSDIARAKAGGYQPGGAIMIHGIKNGFGWLGSLHTKSDWTRGCIAVTNTEIEELWRIVPNGTRVQIKP
jgi:murein L,D-transpeptidase YafK